MTSGKRFFEIYISLKLHFTTTYDVIKYSGKGRFRKTKLDEKKYGNLFKQWGSRFSNEKKLGHFVIANLVYGDEEFPFKPYADAEKVYLRWLRTRESITKETTDDLNKIKDLMTQNQFTFDYIIDRTPKGKLPPLLQMAIFKKINLETLVIIHKEYKELFDTWEDLLYNDPYAQDVVFKLKKYIPFVKYEQDKILPALKILRG